jgi:hypothetical protein
MENLSLTFKPFFYANFKIASVVIIPEISQLHPATSADYSSNMNVMVRTGYLTGGPTLSPYCSPAPLINPLSKPEFDCK